MKVIVAAAGTAGHINPGLAIANKIKEQEKDSEIIFIGTDRGLENDLVPRAGYELKTIDAYGLSIKPSIDNLKKLYKTFKGIGEAKKIVKEFRDFINRGNVIDLAVGVVVGGAFGKIVTSLVNDIIMPLIGLILGGIDFTKLSLTIGESVIAYGAFIQNVIDFLIVAFCIFMLVKFVNKLSELNKKEEKKEENKEEPKKSNEELLLEEIRDLLKKKK